MSLQLILGSAGSGKSYDLYQYMIRHSIEEPDKRHFLLVPEQFTMQTQRTITEMHPRHSTTSIDIVSFDRLAYRVFQELGFRNYTLLDDMGKSMILRKVAQEREQEFHLFRKNLKKPGFITQLKSMLSEFYQYGVGLEQLKMVSGQMEGRPLLKYKLEDLSVAYEGFAEKLGADAITAEEVLIRLCEMAEGSRLLKGSIMALDGFTGFTPIQYRLLSILMGCVERMLVTVTVSPAEWGRKKAESHDLFYLSHKTVETLISLAEKGRTPVEKELMLTPDVPPRFQNAPALAFLEAHYGRYTQKYGYPFAQEAFGEAGAHDPLKDGKAAEQRVSSEFPISVTACQNPEEEVAMAAGEILRLVKEEGLRYRQIAVLTGNMEDYGPLLRRRLAMEGMPCFFDRKKGLLDNPLTEFIRSALEALERNFAYEPVFRHLKCGLASLDREQIDLLENYVIAFGIRGKSQWEKPWEQEDQKAALGNLEELNEIRMEAVRPLLTLWKQMKEARQNVTGYVTALTEFLLSQHIYEKLQEICGRFEEIDEPVLKKEYEQAYGLVMNVFDEIVALLGEETLTLREFAQILDSGLAEIRVGVIPACLDRMVAGDLERTRLDGVKALFLLGVNEGAVPKASDSGGLFSDYDREILKEYQLELAPTARENGFIQKFYLYLALTRAEGRLFLSYAKTDASGKAMKPSVIFHELFRLFPGLRTVDYRQKEDRILSSNMAFSYLSKGLKAQQKYRTEPIWRSVGRILLKNAEFSDRARAMVEAAYYHHNDGGIGAAAAKALYGGDVGASVTRLEQQAACACAQFLAYGLELRERKEFTFAMVDLGTVFHRAIELFFRKMGERQMDFGTITEEERKELTSLCVEEATEQYGSNVLKSNARNAYMVQRILRITDRTVWALGEQIKQSGFVPVGFEVEFRAADTDSLKLPLTSGETMYLNGKIDRVDLKEEEDRIYINIIDYKSGSMALDLTSAYYGLQIQLIFYMEAALETVKKKYPDQEVLPGGVLYYNIKDPVVEKTGEMSEEMVRERMLEQLQMNGLMYPAVNELPKKVRPVSQKQFQTLQAHVMGEAVRLGNEIVRGETAPLPYKKGQRTACDYCQFRTVCGFDLKVPGYRYHRLKEWKPEEIWELLEEEEELRNL